MINQLSNVGWMGILTAFFAYFVLGAMWFTLFFKKQYAVSLGKENSMPDKPALLFIIGPAVCAFIITITCAILVNALAINTYSEGLELALVVGIGFLVANTFNIAINPNMPYPLHYGIISAIYHLVGTMLVCVVLVAMN